MSYHDAHFRQHAHPPTPHFSHTDPAWSGSTQLPRQHGTVTLSPNMVTLSMRQEPVAALAALEGKEKTRKPVDPPPIVRLDVDDRNDPNKHYLFSPHLFVLASLIPEGTDIATTRSQKGIIGETCSAIHRLKDTDNKEGGYFVFGDISVRKPGRYRLQFSLFNSEPPLNYIFIAEVFSNFFTVYNSKDFQGMEESTAISRSFNEQGVRLRMRKEARSRQQVASYHPASEQDDSMSRQHSQRHNNPAYQQLPPASRQYASHPMYAMDERGIKRRRDDETEGRIPPPAQIPRTAYYPSQYQSTQPYNSGLNLSAQTYPLHQMVQPPSIHQPALNHQFYGNLGSIDPEIFK